MPSLLRYACVLGHDLLSQLTKDPGGSKRDVSAAVRTYFDPNFVWDEAAHAANSLTGVDGILTELEAAGLDKAEVGVQNVVPACAEGTQAPLYYCGRLPSGVVYAVMETYTFDRPCVKEYSILFEPIVGNSTERDYLDAGLPTSFAVPKHVGHRCS